MNAALRQALSPARCPSGGLRVSIEGEPCVLRCSGALWVLNHRTLIAADLHLEKGSAFAARGQMLPPYDSRATLDRLEAEIEALQPAAVVLLGDSFHDAASVGRMAADDRARLDRLAAGRDWIWLEGNHDIAALADAMGDLVGEVVETMALGSLRLIHEPQPGVQPGEIAGHLHPAARVAAHGAAGVRGVHRGAGCARPGHRRAVRGAADSGGAGQGSGARAGVGDAAVVRQAGQDFNCLQYWVS